MEWKWTLVVPENLRPIPPRTPCSGLTLNPDPFPEIARAVAQLCATLMNYHKKEWEELHVKTSEWFEFQQ